MTTDNKYITSIYKAILAVDYSLLIYIIIVCLVFITYRFPNPEYFVANEGTTYEGKPYKCWDVSKEGCRGIGHWSYPNSIWIEQENDFLYYNIVNAEKMAQPMFLYIILSRIFLFWRKKKNATSSKN